MPYNYEIERPSIFTEGGQVTFLKIRDTIQRHLKTAGAVRVQEAISSATGDTWCMLACIDHLVELREIREITPPNSCAGQDRVFVARG